MIIFIVVLDAMGFGLVYPLFSAMVFDPHSTLLHPSTSQTVRGILFGILLSSMPVTQMVVAPWIGRLSDKYGRKPVILFVLSFGVLSSLGAAVSIQGQFLIGLILSRACMGVCFVSYALVNTSIVDASNDENRGRRLAWVQSAFGAGFALGPFFWGILVNETLFGTLNYARPFLVNGLLISMNIVCVLLWLPETNRSVGQSKERSADTQSLFSVDKTVLLLLLATFSLCFGWSMYFEFVPVWWIRWFAMSASDIGIYFSYWGILYVATTAFVVGPMLKLFPPQLLFERASFLLALLVLPVFFITVPALYFFLMPFQNLCVGLLIPLTALIISEKAPPDDRGRIIGFQASAESLGFGLSPCLAGPLLGLHLLVPAVIAVLCLLLASLTMRYVRKKSTLHPITS